MRRIRLRTGPSVWTKRAARRTERARRKSEPVPVANLYRESGAPN